MQIQVLNNDNNIPNGIHIALDTCVFLDAFNKPKQFQKFFEFLKSKKIVLVSTYLAYLEFSRGFDTLRDFNKAAKWFDSIVNTLFPIRGLEEYVDKLKIIYRKDGKEVDPADMFLGALAWKHNGKMLVLSKNHKHFITDLFDIQTFIPLIGKNQVQTYCLYKFSEEKYIERLTQLEKTV